MLSLGRLKPYPQTRLERLAHRYERITRYNLGLASIGIYLETVGSYTNNS